MGGLDDEPKDGTDVSEDVEEAEESSEKPTATAQPFELNQPWHSLLDSPGLFYDII